MKPSFYEKISEDKIKYVAFVCRYQSRFVYLQENLGTLELLGGQRQEDTLQQCLERLIEEYGIDDYQSYPVSVYCVGDNIGMLYYLDIYSFSKMHQDIIFMDDYPLHWTYPEVEPFLMEKVLNSHLLEKRRQKFPQAVYAIIINEGEVLLQKREHTGYRDGDYDLASSGHVEMDESYQQALIRECKEELDIDVLCCHFVTMIHKHDLKNTYTNVYFLIDEYSGEIKRNEPEKCSQLQWFDIDDLPDRLIEDRKEAIECLFNGIDYVEMGFE